MSEKRDFAMGRLAAARGHAAAAAALIDDTIQVFLESGEDTEGKERNELLEFAIDSAGDLSRALEATQTALETFKKDDFTEAEPDLPEGDGHDDEDEDDEDE